MSGDCYGRRNRDMTKRLVQRRTALLAAAGTVALLAVVAIPVAAGGNGHGNGNGKQDNSKRTEEQQQQSATGSRNRHGAAWRRRRVAHPVPDPRPQQRQELQGLGSDADLDVLVHRLGLLGLVHDGGGDDRLRRRSPDVVRRHRLRVLRTTATRSTRAGRWVPTSVGLLVCFWQPPRPPARTLQSRFRRRSRSTLSVRFKV